MVYVSTGGAEEVDNESFHRAAECNASIAYAPGSLLYPHSYCSGGVSLYSVLLDILKGYALKLLEAAIKAKSILMPFLLSFSSPVPKFELKKTITESISSVYISVHQFGFVCLLQTKFIFQKTKLQ